jgi:hydrogenase expression/formation protein HypD
VGSPPPAEAHCLREETGHTHAIYRFGLADVLPDNIELIHGPGCPVCVPPRDRVDDGFSIAERTRIVDMLVGDPLPRIC